MRNVMDDSRLKLKHEKPKLFSAVQREMEGLLDFITYYQVENHAFLADAVDTVVNRLSQYAIAAGEDIPEPAISDLLSGELPADTPSLQRILNLQQAIHFVDQNEGKPLTLATLQQMHKLLLQKMPSANTPGSLRTQGSSLFSYIDNGMLLPNHEQLMENLEEALALANDKSQPALQRAWKLFYFLIAVRPFPDENEAIAIMAAHHVLSSQGYGLFGMLNLEKYVFFSKRYLLQTAELFNEQNYLERLDTELTAYLDSCLYGFQENLHAARKRITDEVKKQLGYDTLPPRQKNNLNFWLEKGFYLHNKKLPQLTERQQEIMMLLVRYGSLANKDLVPVFRVDRKTIQRDFNELLERGLVELRGAGRSLRYHLDFRILLG